jgi:hypothetical protein
MGISKNLHEPFPLGEGRDEVNKKRLLEMP